MNDFINGVNKNIYPILVIIIILTFLVERYYKKIRGYYGEFWVKKELSKLPKKDYIVLNNIMIKTNNGTHQIDHIVLSKFGIFVIEMKNFYGLIIGDEYKEKWVQYLGKNKYYFKNPIHQNYGHIKALEETLKIKEDKFISIICISNQAKLKVNAKNVTHLDFINNLIRSYKNEILDIDLEELKCKIESLNITDTNSRKEHVKEIRNNLQEKYEMEKSMICPRCGGKLVEKNGRYGRFIGCSNYPKCRYTKKL